MLKSTLKRTLCAMLTTFLFISMLNIGAAPVFAEESSESTEETPAETLQATDTEATAEAAPETEAAAKEEEISVPKEAIKGTSSFVGDYYTYGDTKIATSLYVPKDYTPDKEYALLIYFHNVGGRGDTPFYTSGSGDTFSKNIIELTNDGTIIFAPRCPTAYFWAQAPYTPGWYNYESTPISKPMSAVVSYIYDEIMAKYNIDKTRVWAYGDSLGAGGTWDLLLREPDLLAGAVPVAGYNDPTLAANVRDDMAIWAVHTAQDKAVNVRGDRAMTAVLKNMGRNVIYSEYDSSNPDDKARWNGHWNKYPESWEHHAWVVAYGDREIAEWLVAQKKPAESSISETKFTDIDPSNTKYKAICYATEVGLFQGTSETTFDPDGVMTRAMFVTVLGRYAGVDTTQYTGVSFTDVVAGSWYAPYVEWANANGIVTGIGNNEFDINGKITIEQACTILGRFAEFKSAENSTKLTLDIYNDTRSIHDWGEQGLTWAIDTGIYMGSLGEASFIRPRTSASRALVASMFYNYTQIFGE